MTIEVTTEKFENLKSQLVAWHLTTKDSLNEMIQQGVYGTKKQARDAEMKYMRECDFLNGMKSALYQVGIDADEIIKQALN